MNIKYNTGKIEEFDSKEKRNEKSTVTCECGNSTFYVNWISASYTGGYLKLTCPACGKNATILDDYA